MSFNIPTRKADELLWYLIDLDDTLAYQIWPEEGIGDPIPENIEKLYKVIEAGYKAQIYTSRPWSDYELIRGWVELHNLPISRIICGKPLGHKIVDDKNINAAEEDWV